MPPRHRRVFLSDQAAAGLIKLRLADVSAVDGFLSDLKSANFLGRRETVLALSAFLAQIDTPLRLVGGAFLLWLGYESFHPNPPATRPKSRPAIWRQPSPQPLF